MNFATRALAVAVLVGGAWWAIGATTRPARMLAPLPGKGDVHLGDEGPACPVRKAFGMKDPPVVRGMSLYALHCAACHGTEGDGRGPAAVFIHPKPRDSESVDSPDTGGAHHRRPYRRPDVPSVPNSQKPDQHAYHSRRPAD